MHVGLFPTFTVSIFFFLYGNTVRYAIPLTIFPICWFFYFLMVAGNDSHQFITYTLLGFAYLDLFIIPNGGWLVDE